jgi:hypothetical protein
VVVVVVVVVRPKECNTVQSTIKVDDRTLRPLTSRRICTLGGLGIGKSLGLSGAM